MTEEESLLLSACWGQQDLHARVWAATFSLVCRTHPELVRQAFAEVFGLEKVVEATRRSVAAMNEAMREAAELKLNVSALCEQVRKDLDRIEADIERLSHLPRKVG